MATNCASRAQQVHGERKLRKVPAGMPDGVAAAFSLNAQTAYSMVRKLDLAPGADVLVMSGGSNAALFTIAALRARGANVYASTSTPAFVARLAALGCAGVAAVPRGGDPRGTDPRRGMPEIVSLAREVGGFDAVVDPFFNLHLATAVQVLNPSGRYVTCGVAGETDSGTGPVRPALPDAEAVLRTVVQKNLTIVGNCLGVTDDLDRALHDYSSGALAVVIDSTFSGEAESAAFLTRTFNSGDRFGKVVFRYEQ